MECPHCLAPVPPRAQFCPRCGKAVADEPPPDGRGATGRVEPLRSGSAFPWAGILFLAGAVLGPAAVVFGIYWDNSFLLYSGIVVSAAVLLLMLLGMLF